MMKVLLFVLSLLILFSCKENNVLEQYKGFYIGNKIISLSYDSVTPNNTIYTIIKYDTVYSKIEIIPDGNLLDIKEFDENSTLIKFWDNAEINNSGDIAYFSSTQTAYGDITPTTLSLTTYYTPQAPNDTNIIANYYTLNR